MLLTVGILDSQFPKVFNTVPRGRGPFHCLCPHSVPSFHSASWLLSWNAEWNSIRLSTVGSHQALVDCGLNTWGSHRLEEMAQWSALSHRVAIILPKLKTKPTPSGLIYMLEQWPVFLKERQQNMDLAKSQSKWKNCHICAETWKV